MKYLLYLIMFGMVACHERPDNLDEMAMADSPPAIQVQEAVRLPEAKQVLLYNASLSLQVGNVRTTSDSVKKILQSFQAYASNENLTDYGDRIEQYMEIRVVETNFHNLIGKLESLAEKTLSREVNVKDVTAEYIDLGARLKTKRELENRYYEILKQAKTVKDMLEVETQLGEVREEIESMESRKQYIDSRVAYSTIGLTFSEDVQSENGFGSRVSGALESGWNNMIQFFLVLLSGWPWVMVVGGIVMLALKVWRKRKRVIAEPVS